MPGKLIVCGTPIGNLGDAPPRLRAALEEASVVYAEDTRRSRTLLRHLGVERPLRSYFAGNEEARAGELAERLERDETVALLTDAGMPAVSDPGLSAVRIAREVRAEVTVVPGPSAVTAAVAVSGLPSERFVFEGFLPRKAADRRSRLEELAAEERTIVLFAAPTRLLEDLEGLADVLGRGREVTVARELTKAFEEVWHGDLGGAMARWSEEPPRGELTLVVAGAPPEEPSLAEALRAARRMMAEEGLSRSAAARRASRETGARRNLVYRAMLEEGEAQP